jgi:hypothetical protein
MVTEVIQFTIILVPYIPTVGINGKINKMDLFLDF